MFLVPSELLRHCDPLKTASGPGRPLFTGEKFFLGLASMVAEAQIHSGRALRKLSLSFATVQEKLQSPKMIMVKKYISCLGFRLKSDLSAKREILSNISPILFYTFTDRLG